MFLCRLVLACAWFLSLLLIVEKPATPDSLTTSVIEHKSTDSLAHTSEDESPFTEAVIEAAPEELEPQPEHMPKEVEEPVTTEESNPENNEPEYSVPVNKPISSDSEKGSQSSVSTTNSVGSITSDSEADKNIYGVKLRRTGKKFDNPAPRPCRKNVSDSVSDIPITRSFVSNTTSLFGESKISKRYSSYEPRSSVVSTSPSNVSADDTSRISDSGRVRNTNEFTTALTKVRESRQRNNQGSPEKTVTPDPEQKGKAPLDEFSSKKLRPVSGKPEPMTEKPAWAQKKLAKTPSPEHKLIPVIEEKTTDSINEVGVIM